ncbi:MAG: GNAT family N-acetyltransferase [Candidatus Cloacimonetes bacterium]|nr:GNAT family N-acetyltransferase [Candidatus Cloacimonadota bacterium]MCF7813627.1 GNAT family N-acetyltransferase [Candidatus Cloacimonadota bacterium]MCF7868306.1 GNAT family N-acetyltransferase [Candidatus Cloacimonadota bacterium]MCF7883781.1 GNAT family N-acetyltransferase [Candidatus Cloacimonadota bacterium]
MYKIINVKEYEKGISEAVKYIHGIWGNESNFPFYEDAIQNSSLPGKPLPRFYLMLDEEKIIGCYALLTNDLISRQDLWPWLGCLFIDKDYRGNQLGSTLMDHGKNVAKKLGYKTIYLTTDHDGYYEKYGWTRIEDGFDLSAERSRIYKMDIQELYAICH